MTVLYFVRHAQPDYRKGEDSTYCLSEEGMEDRRIAQRLLCDVHFDAAVSSPYRRSIMTIEPIASEKGLEIEKDIRLRERDHGQNGNSSREMFRRRWEDLDFCEPGGECIKSVMLRNASAIKEILKKYENRTVLVGTHGTALSALLHYYDPGFGYEGFMRIIDFMPWVIRMDFEGETFLGWNELGFVRKEFHGVKPENEKNN